MLRISVPRMPHPTALAAAGLTAVLMTSCLSATAASAAPTGSGPSAPGVGCMWLPPLPSATVSNPVGQPLYPCGPKAS